MLKQFHQIDGPVRESADVCVIGTGAGGAVVAKELAEQGLDVVILEEGSAFSAANYNQNPGDMLPMLYRDSGATMALGIPPAFITMGRCVGGTTTINSATCFRTPPQVVDQWARQYDCQGLAYAELIPYFEKVEKEIHVVELSEEVLGNNYRIVRRGAQALGIGIHPLRHNVRGCEGAGMCQWGCIKGAKQSTDQTYIPKALKAGARLYANCRAEKVRVEFGRVQSVAATFVDPASGRGGPGLHVTCKVVCLAMGAMITPAFLLKHRLANSSGQVGKGLTIHPCGRVIAEMDEIVDGHHGVSQGGLIDAFKQEGILLEGIFVPPALMGLTLPGVGPAHKQLAGRYRHLAAFGVMVSDTTRGRIFAGRCGYPFIAFYSLNRKDAATLQKGIGYLADIFFAAGARRVFTGCSAAPVLDSRQALEAFRRQPLRPRHFEITAFHPLGTCRMGNDPGRSVVDLDLESHDVKGLFIPDASPFPSSLGVNPQLTIMAFANRTADSIARNVFGGSPNRLCNPL